MRGTRIIMGMPVIVEMEGDAVLLERVFEYFREIDERFSTYKRSSEISKINAAELTPEEYSDEMKEILKLAEKTRVETNGYFDIRTPEGRLDPSGVVKGWAIRNAAQLVRQAGVENFWVEVAGDIQTGGKNLEGNAWSVGIRNPFNEAQIVKVVYPQGKGIATSGNYIRGNHIYNPHTGVAAVSNLVSLTVIGPDVYEADRFATAAFAMGEEGIFFIDRIPNFEGYAIDISGRATMTSGFSELCEAPQDVRTFAASQRYAS